MELAVPGSVANLGGGFDTLAVAVQLYLRVRVLDVRSDGAGTLTVLRSTPPVKGENALSRAYALLAHRSAAPVPSVWVEVESDIPMAAGLGSSAAAAVAGLRVFERVVAPLTDAALLRAATELEGHADNAAAALFGGLTSVVEGAQTPTEQAVDPTALRWRWPDELRLVVATPDAKLATAKARAALPATISRADAVFNLQRVLALTHALQHGDWHGLREAVRDRWHQPARASLVPELDTVLALDDPEILGAFLSGAGPSVAILARRDFERVGRRLASVYERLGGHATVRTLAVHQSSDIMPGALASAHGGTA